MPPWALRVLAAGITTLSLLGSTSYASAHPKNPNAPLQPPVAEKPSLPPEPSPTRAATLRPTPVPQITLQAGVRATALPRVTITHVS